MPKFSKNSLEKIKDLNSNLQYVVNKAIQIIDFAIVSGKRTIEEQKKLVESGNSKTMQSKHLTGDAFDFVPYVKGIGYLYDHNDKAFLYSVYAYYAGIFMGIALEKGIQLRWGGDWNRNGIPYIDQDFQDLGHIECL